MTEKAHKRYMYMYAVRHATVIIIGFYQRLSSLFLRPGITSSGNWATFLPFFAVGKKWCPSAAITSCGHWRLNLYDDFYCVTIVGNIKENASGLNQIIKTTVHITMCEVACNQVWMHVTRCQTITCSLATKNILAKSGISSDRLTRVRPW